MQPYLDGLEAPNHDLAEDAGDYNSVQINENVQSNGAQFVYHMQEEESLIEEGEEEESSEKDDQGHSIRQSKESSSGGLEQNRGLYGDDNSEAAESDASHHSSPC